MAEVRAVSHYNSDQHILLVGEGDFSFAASLASEFKNAPHLVATSLDSFGYLSLSLCAHMHTFGNEFQQRIRCSNEDPAAKVPVTFRRSLKQMEEAGVEVMHGVNIRSMVNDDRLLHRRFDRIVYNFPHSGFLEKHAETSNAVIKRHRRLLSAFFNNASKLLRPGGEVHVTDHVRLPYTKWDIENLARSNRLQLEACPLFKRDLYDGYVNRRGAGAHWGRTFPIHNAATYIFCTA
ncbi:hypothetical protein KP509_18G050800 [Ceratopteris richardii]|uniref:25S rRNA (uridine-N(3))-methyltransferase BMT5-like domain-containing protein n=1 Tax=Ceratopteris richardii TaxID=49495 RepID=A0A8T2SR34_CERRI|nr:hypothetical protein KP509_18G050800 [Ceratopteris richardii]